MTDRPPLRLVGPDDQPNPAHETLQVVLEDLTVAKGHLTEARTVAGEDLPLGPPYDQLHAALQRAEEATTRAWHQTHITRGTP